MTVPNIDLAVRTLGPATIDSPLLAMLSDRKASYHWVDETDRVLVDDTLVAATARRVSASELPTYEPGGPRRKIFFGAGARAAIVTCGGLCPGLNDVIRGIVLQLSLHYGVSDIIGYRNGFAGLIGREPMRLTPDVVRDINEIGGTILGSSRGAQDPGAMVDRLVADGISMLFVIGGDGSLRGALAIADVIAARGLTISVVGVPKTIDNDIPYIDRSFGFQTAFGRATESIRAATVEARAAPNGVGLVKLMGRHSGFIACYAALAKNDADFVLIPEIPFRLEGEEGFLAQLRRRVEARGHAVVILAEGAGQELLAGRGSETDASGNARLHDIGLLMQERIAAHFRKAGLEMNLRYVNPSYAIRSIPPNPFDSVYCLRLAHNAVHAAMAGYTAMVVGRWHGRFVHLPIELVVSTRNTVDPDGDLWLSVLEATGQPRAFS
ncbi:6-phosphofructokinase [Jatrophihabitans sp. GAS493]|uniref:ATP-dependent 6-phosphofructokinase n=1 Tax=Jatrophihabitans sp. GAS493 TaxID=1907575 RepID=UPI000BBF9791|nr:ATP-dependent 6-phosphofructokinase [Jatrophihabitans sp. GAS493]SOD70816.1 6-phosphofructokinase [Jatrophihabitans sp. GAS493]